MEGVVEFYVTCNPPLLPNGVSQMIAYATDDFVQHGKAFEILYDPAVPWFKIIALAEYQAEIKSWFESRLERLLELKTGLVDPDSDDEEFEGENEADGQRVDIYPHLEDPQVVPWALYQNKDHSGTTDYDSCRYPETVVNCQYKGVWRGLESIDGIDVTKLLSHFEFLWPGCDIASALKLLANAAKCEITYNLKGSLVYIGSEQGTDCVHKAFEKLENLKQVLTTGSLRGTHLVFVEGAGFFQILQCYLTNLGLYNQTYVDPHHSEPDEEYQRLQSATSLRVQRDVRGRWITDNTTYVPEGDLSANTWKAFSAFAGYSYRIKQPVPKALYEERITQTGQQGMLPSNLNPATTDSRDLEVAASGGPLSEGSELPIVGTQVQEGVNLPTEKSSSSTDGKILATARINEPDGIKTVEVAQPTPIHLGFEEMTATRGRQPSVFNAIDTWIATLERSYSPAQVSGISSVRSAESSISANEMLEATQHQAESAGVSLVDLSLDGQGRFTLDSNARSGDVQPQDLLVDIDSQIPDILSSPVKTECLLDRHSPQREVYGASATTYPFMGQTSADLTADAKYGHRAEDEEIEEDDLIDLTEPPNLMQSPVDNVVSENDHRTPDRGPTSLYRDNEQTPGQVTAIFDRTETEAKETHQTMRQKASNPGSWAQVAAKKNSRNADRAQQVDFGANVKVKHSQKATRQSQESDEVDQVSGSQRGSSSSKTQRESPPKISTNTGKSIAPKSKGETSNVPSESATNEPRIVASNNQGSTAAADPPQAVPGLDLPAEKSQESEQTRPAGQRKVLQEAKAIIQKMMPNLRITPGLVQIEAKLGRIGLKGMNDSHVGPGTTWSVAEISRQLTERGPGENNTGFYTILTTNGAEADLLPRSRGLKSGGWKLSERKVYYDIFCTYQEDNSHLMIEVDAETFVHRCHRARQEMSGLVIHCPQRAWDVKISASRVVEDVPENFVQFSADIVASLCIARIGPDEVAISAKSSEGSDYEIGSFEIRHVAKYENGVDGSCLMITMTRFVKKDTRFWGNKSGYRGSTVPDASPGNPPTRWFEAAISSKPLENVLKENSGLELGDAASWKPEELGEMLEEIVDPALRMVVQMDGVGCTNQNGHGLKLNQASHDPPAVEAAQATGYDFW